MKKGILFILTIFTLFQSSSVLAQDKKVVVATAGDIKPFSYQNKKGKLTGYDIQVIKAASKYIDGYDISFKKTAWESIFVGIDSGLYQIAANNLSYTEERAEKYLYSVPIAKNPLVLVVSKKSTIDSLDDIAGKTTEDDTGTSTAQLVNEWNEKHTDNPSTITYTGEDVAKRLLDLENGECDYIIFDKVSVDTIIEQKDLNLKTIAIDTDGNPNNYIIFSDDSSDFQKKFNDAIKILYDNGKLEELSEKYLGDSYLPNKDELEVPK